MKEFNAIHAAIFGEEIKITTPNRLLKLQAIIEPDTNTDNLQVVQINHQSILIYIEESLLKNKGVERRQSVIVRGLNYVINEIGSDMYGMSVIRASRV